MKAKLVLAPILLFACAVSGCYMNLRLYPVQGALATQIPSPIFAAKLTGAFNSGHMTVTLTNGEVCKGAWGAVNRAPTQGNTGSATTTADLSSAWDAVYGQGFYTSHILGSKLHVQGVLTGTKGTVLSVELYRPDTSDGLNEVKGVARDNKGNLYKIVI